VQSIQLGSSDRPNDNTNAILDKIQQEFRQEIQKIQRQSESARDVSEVLSVSQVVQRMSREEIPGRIWKYLSSDLQLS
jgi:hypothetical protein